MKKNIFCLIFLFLFTQILSVAAFATGEINTTLNLATATVTVEGTVPNMSDEPMVLTVVALNPGYTAEMITEDNFNQSVNHIAYVSTDNTGNYRYSYTMSGDMGEYNIFVVLKDSEETYTSNSVFFYSSEDLENIADEFKGELSVETIDNLLKSYEQALPTSSDDERLTVAKYLIEDKKVNGDFEDYSSLQRAYKEALIYEKMTVADSTNDFAQIMDDEKELLPFASLSAFAAYENTLDGDDHKEVLQAMLDAQVTHISEYAEIFTEKTILTAIRIMPNWRGVEEFLDTNRDSLTTLDYSAYDELRNDDKNEDVDRAIVGNSYSSLSDLCEAVNDAIAETEDDSKSSSKSSGKSGGKSGGGGSIISVYPTVETTEKTEVSEPKTTSFEDMQQATWAIEAVNYLSEKGIVSGRDEKTFDPNALVTREEFVKMTVLSMGIEGEYDTLPFTDANEDAWYYQYIQSAYAQKIINGINDDCFGIGQTITREDMATILCRALENSIELSVDSIGFSDSDEISVYALESVNKLTNAEIIGGMGDGNFAPKENATRAQVATMLYKALMYKEGK